MKLFDTVLDACIRRFGYEQVQILEEDEQLEIDLLSGELEPMFPLYIGFHSETDLELTAIVFQVPERDTDAFIAQCNTLNAQYPWVKFTVDSGYLCAGMDLLLHTGSAEDVMSMLTALLQVICTNLPGLLG